MSVNDILRFLQILSPSSWKEKYTKQTNKRNSKKKRKTLAYISSRKLGFTKNP